MLFCAPKLVRDLLSRSYARPSAQTVHPFIRLPIYPSVNPSSICQFHSPSTRPFLRSSIRLFFLLSRLSVRPSVRPPVLLPSTLLSVYPCVRSSPFLRPRLSICPSVHPVRRSDLSFWPSVRPSVCLSVFPNTYAFVLSFVRPSNHLSIYNGS